MIESRQNGNKTLVHRYGSSFIAWARTSSKKLEWSFYARLPTHKDQNTARGSRERLIDMTENGDRLSLSDANLDDIL